MADSDGDGRHNGLELGDPWCQWSATNNSPLALATSHPGITLEDITFMTE